MSFRDYYEARQTNLVAEEVDVISYGLMQADIPFEEFWSEVALPTLLEGSHENEEQVLRAMQEGLFGKLRDKLTGMSDDDREMLKTMNRARQDAIGQQQSIYDREHSRRVSDMDQKAGNYKQQMKTAFGSLNRAFSDAVQTYMQTAKDMGQRTGNPALGRIAKGVMSSLKAAHADAARQSIQQRLEKASSRFDAGQAKQADMSTGEFFDKYVKRNPVAGSRAAQQADGGNRARGSELRRHQLANQGQRGTNPPPRRRGSNRMPQMQRNDVA